MDGKRKRIGEQKMSKIKELEEEVQALKSDVMLLIERFDDKLKLVDQNNELLLECRIGDEYHQKLLELGMIKLLENSLDVRDETLEVIKWIQVHCNEMDLQTKTTEEILKEYKNDTDR